MAGILPRFTPASHYRATDIDPADFGLPSVQSHVAYTGHGPDGYSAPPGRTPWGEAAQIRATQRGAVRRYSDLASALPSAGCCRSNAAATQRVTSMGTGKDKGTGKGKGKGAQHPPAPTYAPAPSYQQALARRPQATDHAAQVTPRRHDYGPQPPSYNHDVVSTRSGAHSHRNHARTTTAGQKLQPLSWPGPKHHRHLQIRRTEMAEKARAEASRAGGARVSRLSVEQSARMLAHAANTWTDGTHATSARPGTAAKHNYGICGPGPAVEHSHGAPAPVMTDRVVRTMGCIQDDYGQDYTELSDTSVDADAMIAAKRLSTAVAANQNRNRTSGSPRKSKSRSHTLGMPCATAPGTGL